MFPSCHQSERLGDLLIFPAKKGNSRASGTSPPSLVLCHTGHVQPTPGLSWEEKKGDKWDSGDSHKLCRTHKIQTERELRGEGDGRGLGGDRGTGGQTGTGGGSLMIPGGRHCSALCLCPHGRVLPSQGLCVLHVMWDVPSVSHMSPHGRTPCVTTSWDQCPVHPHAQGLSPQ